MAVDVAALRGRLRETLRVEPGPLAQAVDARLREAERALNGLYRHEPQTWSADPAVQKTIANRLGWMASPELMARSVGRIRTFAIEIKNAGFSDVVLLGMGGSSLAPEVLRAIVGVAPGWPRFHMLDSTDPAAVRGVATPPKTTLYVLASKSGTTIEPNSLAAHFQRTVMGAGIAEWAKQFVAITDAGTELDRRARTERFREVFINPSDIGGRYSALSFFGMVPAALMGQDVEAIVEWARAMVAAAEPERDGVSSNPAAALGLAIGAGARAGRDKMTLVCPPSWEPFGLWVEQLIAESTGKQGTGVVPIAGEPVAAGPGAYADDRLFVRLRPHGADVDHAAVPAAPLVDVDIVEPLAIGAEFVRWEIATAIAGALLDINPFDEPNVQQAKDATKALLEGYRSTGRLPAPTADRTLPGVATLTLSAAAKRSITGGKAEAILTSIRAGDYFALLAYLSPLEHGSPIVRELERLRRAVRDRTRAATMFGFGPRYLHSTGQLHKGGPNTGVFVLIAASPAQDVDIPGQPFSFGTLEQAQALGDFQSLDAAGRRALFVHLASPEADAIRELSTHLLDY